jgi:SAM-dependent methyltransferase
MSDVGIKRKSDELKLIILGIDPDRLSPFPTFRTYFISYQNDIDYILQRYSRILSIACGSRKVSELSLLDFGGGTGFLALLARYCGIPDVVYMDISKEMLQGASLLAELCNIKIRDFLLGSYEDIASKCHCSFDVITNYDVLEHLYNPREAFSQLGSVLADGGVILMASGANRYNPVTNVLLRSYHRRCEHIGVDNKEPMIDIRRSIISDHAAQLSESEKDLLAKLTRGRRMEDIISAVELYLDSGVLPVPDDRTNTCDPDTGNGAENLLDVFALERELQKDFSSVSIGTGLYPVTRISYRKAPADNGNIVNRLYPYLNLLAKILAPVLNGLMGALPLRLRLVLAPHYYIRVEK